MANVKIPTRRQLLLGCARVSLLAGVARGGDAVLLQDDLIVHLSVPELVLSSVLQVVLFQLLDGQDSLAVLASAGLVLQNLLIFYALQLLQPNEVLFCQFETFPRSDYDLILLNLIFHQFFMDQL